MNSVDSLCLVAAAQPVRVVSIAHAAVRNAAERQRYTTLAASSDLDIHLIVPRHWYRDNRIEDAAPPEGPVHTLLEPIRLPRAGRAGWYLHYYPHLRTLLKRLKPDVIHLWEEPWSLVAMQAAWLRNRLHPEAALVLEVDQNILTQLPPPFEAFRAYTLHNADFVLGRHPDAISVVQARGYAGPTGIVEYGLDRTIFRPGDRTTARSTFGAEGFTLGYVGRLIAEKGLEDMLIALTLCRQNVRFLVMGGGPHKPTLEQAAHRLGVAGRVRFFSSSTPSDVAYFMNALDALVLLTRTTNRVREQFGRVIMEAQGCGVPVIGSTCGAIPDVVGSGGWVVPERNPQAIATLVDRLAVSPAEVASAAAAGYRQALERFTFSAVAEALRCAFLTASASRRHQRASEDNGKLTSDSELSR
jgi:glycosyltransferase involved in cell wall biosynthesis